MEWVTLPCRGGRGGRRRGRCTVRGLLVESLLGDEEEDGVGGGSSTTSPLRGQLLPGPAPDLPA